MWSLILKLQVPIPIRNIKFNFSMILFLANMFIQCINHTISCAIDNNEHYGTINIIGSAIQSKEVALSITALEFINSFFTEGLSESS